jgi:hypothetical protein
MIPVEFNGPVIWAGIVAAITYLVLNADEIGFWLFPNATPVRKYLEKK